jgi:hypothetical protein
VQLVVVGNGPDGRSTVLERRDLLVAGDGSSEAFDVETLWSTVEHGTELPQVQTDDVRDYGVASSEARWLAVSLAGSWQSGMHRTDTIDYDVIIGGSTTLALEDGEVALAPGDCIVVRGVLHEWRTGPEGCTMLVTLIGASTGN